MVSWWLILIAAIMMVVVLALVIYLLVLFQSEDDKNQAWFPKFVVIVGLSLACFNVLLLPYDVANRMDVEVRTSLGGGINTVLIWEIVLYSIAGFAFVIVPFAMFYYEARDEENPSVLQQLKPAVAYTGILIVLFCVILFTLWATIGTAEIPYDLYSSMPTLHAPSPVIGPAGETLITFTADRVPSVLEVKVSLLVYAASVMSVIGWVLFIFFGGVGLIAFPMDFINNFRHRPKPITAADYAKMRLEIASESEQLMEEGKKLQEAGSNSSRSQRRKMQAFKQKVQELEDKFEKTEVSYREQGGRLLHAVLSLIVGVIGAVLSLLWLLQIILWNIAHVTPFMGVVLRGADKAFSFLGVIIYGVMAFYLLWAVVIGTARVGVNLLIFTVYPMKVHGTLMNAFLFNTNLILLASVTVVQFSAMSFSEYIANTSVDSIFTTYASRLKYIRYVLLYLQLPLLGVAVLSLLWLTFCPRRKAE